MEGDGPAQKLAYGLPEHLQGGQLRHLCRLVGQVQWCWLVNVLDLQMCAVTHHAPPLTPAVVAPAGKKVHTEVKKSGHEEGDKRWKQVPCLHTQRWWAPPDPGQQGKRA